MKGIRFIIFALCAAFLALGLSACGGDGQKTKGGRSSSATYEETGGDVYEQFDPSWIDG